MTSRRAKLEAMLADEPTNTFLRYGLAVELEKEGDLDECLTILDTLTQEQPPYVPAYFMSAQYLAGTGETSAARQRLRDGIEAAGNRETSTQPVKCPNSWRRWGRKADELANGEQRGAAILPAHRQRAWLSPSVNRRSLLLSRRWLRAASRRLPPGRSGCSRHHNRRPPPCRNRDRTRVPSRR